ncbi:MAG: hypothetical protein AAF485_12155 [Chloroflexota bacterium]
MMRKEIYNQQQNLDIKHSFRQKSAVLSLVIISSAAIYYIVNMWLMRPIALTSDTIPAGYGSLVLTTIVLIIVAQIVLQIVLVVGSGDIGATTPHQKSVALKAARNAYGVLAFGLFAAIGSVFLEELTPFCTANLAILGLFAAEITELSSQLIYHDLSATKP